MKKPTHEQVQELVLEVIVDQLGVKREKVLYDTNLSSDLGADSLDIIQIVMEMEEVLKVKYGVRVEVPDDALDRIATYRDLVEYVCGEGLGQKDSATSSRRRK